MQEVSSKFASVQILRGLAALSVAWFHLTGAYADGLAKMSGSLGWLGVDVFFVISGFIVPYSLQKRFPEYRFKNYSEFVLRRIIRLDPPYIASILLAVTLTYISSMTPGFRGGTPHFSISQVLAHLFYGPPILGYDWIQPVYWTLAYEFIFYLSMGVLFIFIQKPEQLRNIFLIIAVLFVSILRDAISEKFVLFILGFIVFRALNVDRHSSSRCWALFFIFIACLGIFIIKEKFEVALVGSVTAVTLLFTCGKIYKTTRLTTMLMALGTISYSLYLVHVPVGGRVINLGLRLITSDGNRDFPLSFIALAASLLVAYLFYVIIERPSMRLASASGRNA
jgi:peptidoglycan/LPS O-acetylase OafA/YrhL